MRVIYAAIVLVSITLTGLACFSTGLVSEENNAVKLVTAAFELSSALTQEPVLPTPSPFPEHLVNTPTAAPSTIPEHLVNTPTPAPRNFVSKVDTPTPAPANLVSKVDTPTPDSALQTPAVVQTGHASSAIQVIATGSPSGASSLGIINAASAAALSCVVVGLIIAVGLIYRQKRRR